MSIRKSSLYLTGHKINFGHVHNHVNCIWAKFCIDKMSGAVFALFFLMVK